MSGPPVNARLPLIVVKRVYFDQYAAGTKTIEYRRHRKPFTRTAFYPGRWVRIAPNFNIKKHPALIAEIVSFRACPAFECFEALPLQRARDQFERLRELYPGIEPETEIAMIGLRVERGAR